jgi:hypothetical protein
MSSRNRCAFVSGRAGWIAVVALLAGPGLARAQSAPAPPPSGEMIVETMQSGFVLAPDFRFTEVDDDFGGLAGVRAGWLTDDRLFIGGAGYWLTNGDPGRKMAYGGLAVEWSLARSRRVGVSFGALVGGGTSTLTVETTGFPRGRFHEGRHGWFPDPGEPQTFLVGVGEGYFVAEPRATASLMLTRWLRVGAGVSYRLIAGAGDFNDRLGGVAGTVSVQLGTF